MSNVKKKEEDGKDEKNRKWTYILQLINMHLVQFVPNFKAWKWNDRVIVVEDVKCSWSKSINEINHILYRGNKYFFFEYVFHSCTKYRKKPVRRSYSVLFCLMHL